MQQIQYILCTRKWTVRRFVTGSHCFYKYVCVVASNRKTTHPREGASRTIHTMNLQYVAVINDSQIVAISHTPSKVYLPQIMWYYITRRGSVVCCQASISYYWEKEERKGLVGQFRYDYYCGPTKDPALIRDPTFIFVILLFPPATKRDQAFIQDRP